MFQLGAISNRLDNFLRFRKASGESKNQSIRWDQKNFCANFGLTLLTSSLSPAARIHSIHRHRGAASIGRQAKVEARRSITGSAEREEDNERHQVCFFILQSSSR
jgi:hypothetical protein